MDRKIKLEKEHPSYVKAAPRYKRWRDLYVGGESVEKGEYLVQHPYETEKQFKIRKDRAAYRNYAAPIVDVFTASLWRAEPVREFEGSALEPIMADVDRGGNATDDFFFGVASQAAAVGQCFVMVDMPPVPDGVRTTVEQDRALGRRPYFVRINAEDVIDWGFDEQGALAWAVVREKVVEADEAFGERKEVKQYRLLAKDKWEVWRQNEKGDAVKFAEGSNGLGVVPLVRIAFSECGTPMVGTSCLDDVTSLCLRVYRRDSELDKSLFDGAVALFVATGAQPEELEAFVKSSSNGLCISNPEARVSYVEPEGRSFDALRQAIADDERAIREIALRQVRPDSRVGESAEAKKLDNTQLNSQLARFSQAVEAGEKECWRLAAKWLGVADADPKVEYSRDFDEEEISGDLLRAFSELRRNGDISRDTLFDLLKRWEVLPPEFDPKEEEAKLEDEARKAAATAPNPAATAGDLFRQAAQGGGGGTPAQ